VKKHQKSCCQNVGLSCNVGPIHHKSAFSKASNLVQLREVLRKLVEGYVAGALCCGQGWRVRVSSPPVGMTVALHYGVLIPLTRLDCLQLEGRASEAS